MKYLAAALTPALALCLSACGSEEAGGASPAAAQAWNVDHDQSQLLVHGQYGGNGFTGAFGDWSADIVFSPDNLEASSIRAEIRVASLDTGDGQRDNAATGPLWLDADEFPTAVYEAPAGSIAAAEEGGYVAEGALTIVGVTTPLALDFDVQIDGDTARATGQTRFDHHEYGFDGGSYDEDTGDEFIVEIDIVATRADAAE